MQSKPCFKQMDSDLSDLNWQVSHVVTVPAKLADVNEACYNVHRKILNFGTFVSEYFNI